MSPAVPDPPNVFAFLDPEGSVIDGGEEEEDYDRTPKWTTGHSTNKSIESSLPPHMLRSHAGSSSSASSSHHSDDNSSEVARDVDTDRTTPEGSVGDQEEENQQQEESSSESEQEDNDASAKVALQMAAAERTQNYHGQLHAFGTPNMQRGPANLPHVPSSALSPRHQQHIKQHPLPRAEKIPVSGYELLASQLSSRPFSTGEEKIKPIYRKFEALNHRVLLHLQDELSELEEQLHHLDHTDTQSRRTDHDIIPASRRQAAAAGGELQYRKNQVLGQVGFKLAQYSK